MMTDIPTAIQEGVRYTTYREHMTNIRALERRIHAVEASVAFIAMDREAAEPNPLPAPALTEQAIVDALKADPAMAGRVMAVCGFEYTLSDITAFGAATSEHADRVYKNTGRRLGLQSLAVALAAASYRG